MAAMIDPQKDTSSFLHFLGATKGVGNPSLLRLSSSILFATPSHHFRSNLRFASNRHMDSTTSEPDTTRPFQSLTESEFRQLIHSSMKCTYRSHDGHTAYLPLLTSTPSREYSTVLIGDSGIERFATTGSRTRTAQLPSCINLGVGGDRIENVLYRLDSDLFTLLQNRGIKVWVLKIGANHLGRKKGLKRKEVDLYRVLLHALFRIAPGSKVVAAGLGRRRDVDEDKIERSNGVMRECAEEVDRAMGGGRVVWVDVPEEINAEEHLSDHCHMNEEGYRIWDEVLYPMIVGLLT
ncbi:hypothetical protein VTL71DRAFT_12284 [Oculimacula yallundae]|uniref:SGNH hydrolase-type esterase domain-containing protein n=1 Tax=Oculimacula yallundae TaxID=86028 RepID=A0ABR4CM75_9HELO